MEIRFCAERKASSLIAVKAVGSEKLIDSALAVMPPDYENGDCLKLALNGYSFKTCVVDDVLIVERAFACKCRKSEKTDTPLNSRPPAEYQKFYPEKNEANL